MMPRRLFLALNTDGRLVIAAGLSATEIPNVDEQLLVLRRKSFGAGVERVARRS
jgi:hypothetical protein